MNNLHHQRGKLIQVADDVTPARFCYLFDPTLPKPCVHPWMTRGGIELTGFQMSDHVWHRGLWFTIKFLNGVNYWEEHAPFGVQRSREEPCCTLMSDDRATLMHHQLWSSDAQGVVLEETRRIDLARAEGGTQIVDWHSSLRPTIDLTLDRTPFTTWGGYGGLSFRFHRGLHDLKLQLHDGSVHERVAGTQVPWFIMTGRADGGADRTFSMGVVSHPSNLRSPQPLYARSVGQPFWNYAFLFHEPLVLPRGSVLDLRYRVVVRDGAFEPMEFEALREAFIAPQERSDA